MVKKPESFEANDFDARVFTNADGRHYVVLDNNGPSAFELDVRSELVDFVRWLQQVEEWHDETE